MSGELQLVNACSVVTPLIPTAVLMEGRTIVVKRAEYMLPLQVQNDNVRAEGRRGDMTR
jgi:hypothetical protein